jgi:hypothetical protein
MRLSWTVFSGSMRDSHIRVPHFGQSGRTIPVCERGIESSPGPYVVFEKALGSPRPGARFPNLRY